MPVVISDAGPLIHLSQIGKLQLLEKLFDAVLITAKVKVETFDEGVRLSCADAQAIGEALKQGWLRVEPVSEQLCRVAEKLAAGENISRADAEALLLAKEKQAEFLVDDKPVSDLAKMYELKVWSTWTLLLESLSKDLITITDIKSATNELGNKKFKLNTTQTKEILNAATYIQNRKKKPTKS